MSRFSWLRRKKRRKKSYSRIPKLTGAPFTNIPRWLYERTKYMKTNVLDPSKRTKTKDKKIDVPKLQRVLMTVVTTINRLITMVNRIPQIEKRLDNLEQAHASDISQLKRGKAKKKHSHSMASKIGSAYMSYATMGMMEEGGVVKSKRTKPVVANKQQLKDRKKQLIDDIMGL